MKTSWKRYLLWTLVSAWMFAGAARAGSTASNAVVQELAGQPGSVPPGILYPPLPTNMSLPTYDYFAAETHAGSHFITGSDRTSRVLGVIWNAQTKTWDLTGSGWLSGPHSQTAHGATENQFCAKCHSPMQASASAGFNNGLVTNAGTVPQERVEAVTCAVCHLNQRADVSAVITAFNPNALGVGIYLWKGVNNPASYQILLAGQEDMLCLHCHEQRHNTDDTAFSKMYAVGVKCIDCHMAQYVATGGSRSSPERFHDWKVGTNLPYSCGAQGSVSGCHQEFTVTDAQNIIPFIRQQHSDWWALPPFNDQPQVAISAHNTMTVAEYQLLWRELAKTDSGAVK